MIHFNHRPTLEDFNALNRHVLLRQLRTGMIFAGLMVTGSLVHPFVVWFLHKNQGLPAAVEFGPMNFIAPLLILVFVIVMRRSIRKHWETVDSVRAEKEYRFEEDGLVTLSGQERTATEWERLERVTRTDSYFFLRVAGGTYFYFPVAVVPDPDQLATFLAGKIPAKVS